MKRGISIAAEDETSPRSGRVAAPLLPLPHVPPHLSSTHHVLHAELVGHGVVDHELHLTNGSLDPLEVWGEKRVNSAEYKVIKISFGINELRRAQPQSVALLLKEQKQHVVMKCHFRRREWITVSNSALVFIVFICAVRRSKGPSG